MSLANLVLVRGRFTNLVSRESPISEELSLGRKVLQDLSEQGALSGDAAPPHFSEYFEELRLEEDPAQLFQGLFWVAQRFKTGFHDAAAQAILGRLAKGDLPAWVRQKAETEASAWTGDSFGIRIGFLFSRFCRDATDWRIILPALGAGLVGKFVGTAALSRFVGMMAKGAMPWPAKGLGARLGAGVLGYLAEVPAYAGLSRALGAERAGPFSQDLKPLALSLGAMKIFGGLGNVGARFLIPAGASPGGRAFFASQFSGLLGLMSAQKLEGYLGLRPEVPIGTLLFDSLTSLLSLSVGTRLGQEVLGERWARLQEDLELLSRREWQLSEKPSLRPAAGEGFALEATGQGRLSSDKDRISQTGMRMDSNDDRSGGSRDPQIGEPTIEVDPSLIEDSKDPLLDQVLDNKYEIQELLGKGGMGRVYKATHIKLGRKVAIKVLSKDWDATAVQRFRNEARAIAAIANPHIVTVYDSGEPSDGKPYFVMEYLNGQSLHSLVRGSEHLSAPKILNIAYQLTEGLAAAHDKGIIHRDLKPQNIFLVQHGSELDFVKVLDFGVARDLNNDNRLTQAGKIFGTPQYVSPEQATKGGEVDQRSDVYAVGVILYELVSGKVPFNAKNEIDILLQHIHRPLPPLLAPQGIPPELGAVITRCLAKNPDHRYQSMGELGKALRHILDETTPKSLLDPARQAVSDSGPVVRPPSEPRTEHPPSETPEDSDSISSRRLLPMIGGLGSVLAIGTLAALAIHRTRPMPSAGSDVMPPQPDAGKVPNPNPPLPDASQPKLESAHPVGKKIVALKVVPSDASVYRVYQSGKPVLLERMAVEVEEGALVELEIRCPGFETEKITLDGSQNEFSIQMKRELPIKKPPSRKRKDQEPTPPKTPSVNNEAPSPWK